VYVDSTGKPETRSPFVRVRNDAESKPDFFNIGGYHYTVIAIIISFAVNHSQSPLTDLTATHSDDIQSTVRL